MATALPKLGRILVVDDSHVWRETMKTVLRVHSNLPVEEADTLLGAIACVDADPEIALVLCDLVLPDGDGFELLEHLERKADPKPAVIVATMRPSDAGRRAALRLGAAAYYAKPIAPRDLLASLKAITDGPFVPAPRLRTEPVGHAIVTDPTCRGEAQLRWPIDDVGRSGAFLRSGGPVDLGTELELELEIHSLHGRAKARVERVQEPSWKQAGGIGVRFVHLDPSASSLLDRLLLAQIRPC